MPSFEATYPNHKPKHQVWTRIVALKRLKNTPDDSPQWELTTLAGIYQTTSAQVGYMARKLLNHAVTLNLDTTGHIIDITPGEM